MSQAETAGAVARLEAAADELESARAAIEAVGESRVERVADAYHRFDDLLERYREPASGTGGETFRAYVEFEGELEAFVGSLPADLHHREAFEAAEELLDRRRLEERDFDRAQEALDPAREVAELLDRRESAVADYREARHGVEARRRELDDELDDAEAVLAYEDVDFDAPVASLRDPIEAYEAAVDGAFRDFRSSAPARAVLDFVDATDAYPLVDYPLPPAALRTYLRDHPAGEEPIPTVLEWAGYTRSKLDHYVADPATFRARLGGNRTYLERLDAGPLHVGWPPPPAEELRFRARELVPLVERFAPEPVVERLHAVRDLTRTDDYARLRRVAVAREALSPEALARLEAGEVQDELETLRAERERLTEALEAHPPA